MRRLLTVLLVGLAMVGGASAIDDTSLRQFRVDMFYLDGDKCPDFDAFPMNFGGSALADTYITSYAGDGASGNAFAFVDAFGENFAEVHMETFTEVYSGDCIDFAISNAFGFAIGC